MEEKNGEWNADAAKDSQETYALFSQKDGDKKKRRRGDKEGGTKQGELPEIGDGESGGSGDGPGPEDKQHKKKINRKKLFGICAIVISVIALFVFVKKAFFSDAPLPTETELPTELELPTEEKLLTEEKMPVGTKVEFNVRSGIKKIEVPKVVGLTLEEAQEKLKAAGLTYRCVKEFHKTVGEGIVIWQSEEGGQMVKEKTKVELGVSKGAEPLKEEKKSSGTKGQKASEAVDHQDVGPQPQPPAQDNADSNQEPTIPVTNSDDPPPDKEADAKWLTTN